MQRLGKSISLFFTGILLGEWLWTAPPVGAACRSDIVEATTPTADFTLDDILGIATHHPTGLTWIRCALGQNWDGTNKTCTGSPANYSWGQALRVAKGYAFADHSDWRLPNIKELVTITEYGCYPNVNETVFPGAKGRYWSSTGWHYVNLGNEAYKNYHVRLVRGGQSFGDYPDSTTPPNNSSSSRTINITINTVSPSRYRLLGTLVDANKQPACGLALASGRCVFTCGPGSLRCEGATYSLPLRQLTLTYLPTEADGALNLQTFVFGSMPGLQVVQSDGTARLVDSGASRASSGAINTQRHEVSPGRHRLTGTLVDANNQPACGLALASGRCVFTCGPGSLRCEGGASNLPLGQFELTDLPAEANGALNLQTFVFGSLPGLQVVNSGGGGCSHTIDPTSQTFTYEGGTGTVNVSTPSGCTWTAASNSDWIKVTGGNSGAGPGQVTYTVASHSSSSQRRGTLTIAGQTLTVLQAPKSDDGGGGGGH